jgi:hypothetical protein
MGSKGLGGLEAEVQLSGLHSDRRDSRSSWEDSLKIEFVINIRQNPLFPYNDISVLIRTFLFQFSFDFAKILIHFCVYSLLNLGLYFCVRIRVTAYTYANK